ncbi:pentatricopeptide repeat-containing protein At1g43980, mitochondrial-like [Curcuma longa]|uniref:pentatricopeptide repeat-containing protein At1g43980, mitochondrial-like n=1 Tax=Curcuma longa TaxID=136217 RepID=UPI003D9E680B
MIIAPPSSVTAARSSLSLLSSLIHRSVALGCFPAAQAVHASLIKTAFHRHTVLGNRLLDLYSGLGASQSAVAVFHDIPYKNIFTWNILLKAFLRDGQVRSAHRLFDEMPERDVEVGVKPSSFTLSIAASCATSALQAKLVHSLVVRFGLGSSNVVLGNSLIDMYGRLDLVGYASHVFHAMDEVDLISWNSIISAYSKSDCSTEALESFHEMWISGFSADEFTASCVLNVCANLMDLAKGEQLLAHCFKAGFLSNSIVSSAVIDMYSMCGRLDKAVQVFQEMTRWDSPLCNSMLASYFYSGCEDEALTFFVAALRNDVKPTEFTFATVLNSRLCCSSIELGTQLHCWVCKTGFESDMITANALLDMYAKLGLVEDALNIFYAMASKDLVAWNTVIMGLGKNGQGLQALRIFGEMQKSGMEPDKITLIGILLACSYTGMVHEGRRIFSSMEKKYGVTRDLEHYACVVEMMGHAGRLKEAMDIIETSPHNLSLSLWSLLLEACWIHNDLAFSEIIAEKLLQLKACSSLPYLVLIQIYTISGKWESMARVQKIMRERGLKKVKGHSWICIRNYIHVFEPNQIFHCKGEAIYSILGLLDWVMEVEEHVHEKFILLEHYDYCF